MKISQIPHKYVWSLCFYTSIKILIKKNKMGFKSMERRPRMCWRLPLHWWSKKGNLSERQRRKSEKRRASLRREEDKPKVFETRTPRTYSTLLLHVCVYPDLDFATYKPVILNKSLISLCLRFSICRIKIITDYKNESRLYIVLSII